MIMSFVTKLNFWRRKFNVLEFGYIPSCIFIHGNNKHERFLVLLVHYVLKRHQHELNPVNAILTCLCLSIGQYKTWTADWV